MNRNYRRNNKSSGWIGLVVILLLTEPILLIPIAIFGGIFWLISSILKKQQKTATHSYTQIGPGSTTRTYTQTTADPSGRFTTRTVTRTTHTTRTTSRKDTFDECPQSFFCRHKDKAEHHVKRGKEVDPWDRPDIDISKYQRKQ